MSFPRSSAEDETILLEGVKREGESLSLAFRPFRAVPDEIAAREGRFVTTLNLTECELTSFVNLQCFPRLQTLVLDKNDLEDISGCPLIPTLSTLWCNNNKIKDLSLFLSQVRERFPRLIDLSLMRNPACPGLMDIQQPDLEACRLYRLYVVFRMPGLLSVDGKPITEEERRDAAVRGHFAETRRLEEHQGPPVAPKQGLFFFPNPIPGSSVEYDPLGVRPSADAGAYKPTGRSVGVLTVSHRRYDGAHSEGNRFIVDDQL